MHVYVAEGNSPACAATALRELPKVPRSPSYANIAVFGLGCATELESPEERTKTVAALEAVARDALGEPRIALAHDDRSGVYEALVAARESEGDAEGAKRVAADWARFLDDAASAAKTAEQRAVFDSHRMSAYIQLGAPERAVPMLEAAEKELPDDYNPPARLSVVYRLVGALDKALAASDRALSKVYGPRRLRVLADRADVLVAMQKIDDAKATLDEALKLATELPKAQVSRRMVKRLEEKKSKL
jgi:tetratricopeptide (TPR) repeat protein